jgi:hypothetical protein
VCVVINFLKDRAMTPNHINSVQWTQALGYSRQSCARVFRDGGTPAEALAAFGLDAADVAPSEWSRAVDMIATSLCHRPLALAA